MKTQWIGLRVALIMVVWAQILTSQTASTAKNSSPIVPRLVNFSGHAMDASGKTISGIVGVTFAIYREQQGGAPLWVETQSVNADPKGNFSAQLGSTKPGGLPLELFSSNESRWLGIRVNGGEEQPRVLLLSVPYALKAADAETVGGLPASAFVLATPAGGSVAGSTSATTTSALSTPPPPASAVTTSGGTTNSLPFFSTATDIESSAITQTGSGATAKIGIGTTAPVTTLDVKGGATVRGVLSLPTTGTATATAGKNSQAESFAASAFNSSTAAAINQTFQWKAEPANNNTANPSAILSLLYGSGTTAPADTGLRLGPKGILGFAAGQTFPGTGSVSNVGLAAPSSDFTVTGSPITSSGTLGLSWTVAPDSNDTANGIVKRDALGGFTASSIVAVSGYSDGVRGESTIGGGFGVNGRNVTYGGTGVTGTGDAYGVSGVALSSSGNGLIGNGANAGVYGSSSSGYGVYGTGGRYGLYGASTSLTAVGAVSTGTGEALYVENLAGGYAGVFEGDVLVAGNLSKSSGSFQIDHPLDPSNKFLYHSFVESPDMMNIYNGNVTTDKDGDAVVTMPDWFEALNRDFRYQLTVMGQFAQAIVAKKMSGNHFAIKTDKPNVEVSWQVTGVRHDAWANAHRIPVEQEKPEGQRGLYLNPELFGASAEKSIVLARHPGPSKLPAEKSSRKP